MRGEVRPPHPSGSSHYAELRPRDIAQRSARQVSRRRSPGEPNASHPSRNSAATLSVGPLVPIAADEFLLEQVGRGRDQVKRLLELVDVEIDKRDGVPHEYVPTVNHQAAADKAPRFL